MTKFYTVPLLCLLVALRNGETLAFTTSPTRSQLGRRTGSTNSLNSSRSVVKTETIQAPSEITSSDPAFSEEFPLRPVATVARRRKAASPMDVVSSVVFGNNENSQASREYQRGLVTIVFITFLFASNSPVLHAAFQTAGDGSAAPPALLLNAAVSVVALVGLLLGGETLEQNTELPTALEQKGSKEANFLLPLAEGQEPQEFYLEQERQPAGILAMMMNEQDSLAIRGGCELGLWKFLGTTANIYGLSLTTAAHGAFLIQLTTLIVPVVQGLQGVPIPKRIQFSVVLALAGVLCFTQDPTGTPSLVGDILCVIAAGFYATYDLRLFLWGKQVAPRRLITSKIGTQALLSLGLLLTAGSTSGFFGAANAQEVSGLTAWQETMNYLSDNPQWSVLIPVVLWSGVAVNAIAPFLQVGGQQAVGPTRCQTIYASQPLWAAIMGFVVFGETIGWQGLFGGTAFMTALLLAATAEAPDPDCGKEQCEV